MAQLVVDHNGYLCLFCISNVSGGGAVSFLAGYSVMAWVTVVLKRRDVVLSQLSKDISLDDKMKLQNLPVLVVMELTVLT